MSTFIPSLELTSPYSTSLTHKNLGIHMNLDTIFSRLVVGTSTLMLEFFSVADSEFDWDTVAGDSSVDRCSWVASSLMQEASAAALLLLQLEDISVGLTGVA